MHWGRYGYPDDQNFVANLLPSTTFLLNWKFLRKSLFYGFLPFLTTFFNSFQLLSLFPDLFFQIVWEFFFLNFSSFFFEFFEPDPLIVRIKGLAFPIATVPRTSKSVKNWAIYGPKKGFLQVYHFSCMYFKTHFCGHRPNYWCIGVDMHIQTTRISSGIYCPQRLFCQTESFCVNRFFINFYLF